MVKSALVTSNASYTFGTASAANCTSTTAPMISTIFPELILVSSKFQFIRENRFAVERLTAPS
jgi:hypothetical protein